MTAKKKSAFKAKKPHAAAVAAKPEDQNDASKTTLTAAKVAAIARTEAKEVVNKQVSGFGDFIRDQGVIGVGIGLVLGIQVKAVVDTIMASFVNPLTQLLLPGKEALSAKTFTITLDGSSVSFGWGAIVYSIFTFVMVALIVYAGYKLLRLDRLSKKKEEKKEEPKPEDKKAKK